MRGILVVVVTVASLSDYVKEAVISKEWLLYPLLLFSTDMSFNENLEGIREFYESDYIAVFLILFFIIYLLLVIITLIPRSNGALRKL